jgi:hypothetical protein
MKRSRIFFISSVVALVGVGCADGGFSRGEPDGDAGGSSEGGGSGQGGDPGQGGEDGAGGEQGEGGSTSSSPTTHCAPEEGLPVDASCGLFVRVGSFEAPDGTMENPYPTLAQAVADLGEHTRIYICSGDEVLDEAVVIPSGTELYGGLDCVDDWRWKLEDFTIVSAPVHEVALKVTPGSEKTIIEGVYFYANDATLPGASSIAAIFDHADVELRRVWLWAGEAAPGADGANGNNGSPGGNGGPGAGTIGGIGGSSACATSGGGGGNVAVITSGGVGYPGHDGNPNQNNGGYGQGIDTAPCQNGGPGANGALASGSGQHALPLGTLTADGFVPFAATQGVAGGHGGGGGGGGADSGPVGGPYGAGGGGGGGGCGGGGGLGGQTGGSSIGLISLDSKLSFDQVLINVSGGKMGGVGGQGGLGASGGNGGPGVGAACDGGPGGSGQPGSNGGNGAGGNAIVVAHTGQAPNLFGASYPDEERLSAAAAQGDGAPGVAAVVKAF